MEALYEILVGGIHGKQSARSEGGEDCINEMTMTYRVIVNIISFIIFYLLLVKITPSIQKTTEKRHYPISPKPGYIEKASALVCLFAYIWQLYIKIASKRLIFMLSPCHNVVLSQFII